VKEPSEDLSKVSVSSSVPWVTHPGAGLFLASFLSLFLELLLIRWVPSLIRIVAYYGNLMLISSFLGLGCGVLLARRRLGLYKWFAPLFFLLILFVMAVRGVQFRQGPEELRFLFEAAAITTTLPIVIVFALNALVFVPLGDLMGDYFQRLPPLKAYAWDLGGAITGTALFGLFSYFWFSPFLGCLLMMTLYLFLYRRSAWTVTMTSLFFLASLALMVIGTDQTAIWSPYNQITVKRLEGKGAPVPVSAPPGDIGTVQDPPLYIVEVNHDFYMLNGTINSGRYRSTNSLVEGLIEQYSLPYLLRPNPGEVLVVGAGGGVDVEAALLHGAKHVDAVEIDPAIVQIGHKYNPSQSYKDPRASIHNTDARAFFKRTKGSYDMIVFGFLDSQSLFSQMSNIRLDGYVYTRESFQEAFRLLRPGGLMSVSFFSGGKEWLIDRLIKMVRHAADMAPLVYLRPSGQVIILVGRGFMPKGPERLKSYRAIQWKPGGTPEAQDDWPYLYLMRRFIPSDYLVTIAVLLAVTLAFLFFSSEKKEAKVDYHFFLLGAGFLLLETKSITTISLYFGTTWLVSMIVILGVLIMVFLANLVAFRVKRFSLLLYLPLIASLGFLYLFPTQNVVGWPFFSRLIYSLVVIPLPIFFAGLIFSSTFRESVDPPLSFGSNLLGAMVGGFTEYLGMVTGMRALLLVVLGFYLASLLVRLRTPNILPARA
jgi:SAM-dependent methyltransferase